MKQKKLVLFVILGLILVLPTQEILSNDLYCRIWTGQDGRSYSITHHKDNATLCINNENFQSWEEVKKHLDEIFSSVFDDQGISYTHVETCIEARNSRIILDIKKSYVITVQGEKVFAQVGWFK